MLSSDFCMHMYICVHMDNVYLCMGTYVYTQTPAPTHTCAHRLPGREALESSFSFPDSWACEIGALSTPRSLKGDARGKGCACLSLQCPDSHCTRQLRKPEFFPSLLPCPQHQRAASSSHVSSDEQGGTSTPEAPAGLLRTRAGSWHRTPPGSRPRP